MNEPKIPVYYRASLASPEVIDALRIHPVGCAVISRDADQDTAALICGTVLRVLDDKQAIETALWASEHVGQGSVVIIGGEVPLEAVYQDGQRETICAAS